ncbi:MAG: 16S rRNA (uracil(1498)-N(3))-methyltransferase [Spirochaetaceae bacterium]|jgi:RsmE family RNA methyltransferase|nr:16S rRNA (uracil(1498)-N(3))-methyltransferase [Spirochaetaceae bacterium]
MNIILFEHHEFSPAAASDGTVTLQPRDKRTIHLLKVLRKKRGDRFDAGVLEGNWGTGTITSISPEGELHCSLELCQAPLPRSPISLAVGFPRPIQLKRLLRDLATFGVERVDLIGTELGEPSYRNTTLLSDGGAREALIQGAIQARDTVIPALRDYASLTQWLEKRPWKEQNPLLIAADNLRPAGTFAQLQPSKQPLLIAIGSERGWSDRERTMLEEAGFCRLSLGNRALRTETACVAAVVSALEKIGTLGYT